MRYLSIILVFALSSCGPSHPADSETEAVLKGAIDAESNGKLQLKSFEKTATFRKESQGVDLWQVEFKYSFAVKASCYKVDEIGIPTWYRNFKVLDKDPREGAVLFIGNVIPLEAGTVLTQSGFAIWEKTEEGWRVKSLDRAK